MALKNFHNPNISWHVVKRRIGEELLHLAIVYIDAALTRGRSLHWSYVWDDQRSYRNAVRRLEKDGLVFLKPGEPSSVIGFTEAAITSAPRALKPERWWKKKWNGTWYVFLYDVPESTRTYRDAIRRFLQNKKLGQLQRSVYVTTNDIRPDYSDLLKLLYTRDYTVLFEAKTVLGQSPSEIVQSAWDFDKLRECQSWYLEICEHNLAFVLSGELSRPQLENLAREEMTAYLTAMENDPLLPATLHPKDYLGRAVYGTHKKIVGEIGKRL